MPRPIIQIAPMMGYTDRHCRYFFRLLSENTQLFTEMIHAKAILHGKRDELLAYHDDEHPVCLQLGGSDPKELASATRVASDYRYDEVNLNVGCPSSKVLAGAFGACLMAKPELVAECVDAMRNASNIPISVKTRIGIDKQDNYEFLYHFVETVSAAGCKTFIIHARKAWLKGLSPKENREVPPLQYDTVYQLKRDFPNLTIVLNGGIRSIDDIKKHVNHVDGVMIGRAAYQTPYVLAEIDQCFYENKNLAPSRQTVLANLIPYLEQEQIKGTKPQHITRHILGLFHGLPQGKHWRRLLASDNKLAVILSAVELR